MSFALVVYLISILNGVGFIFFSTAFILLVTFVGLALFEGDLKFKSQTKYVVLVFAIISSIICALIPNKQDAYLIAGTYAAEKVYNSEIGQDVMNILQLKIKQQLKEIQ